MSEFFDAVRQDVFELARESSSSEFLARLAALEKHRLNPIKLVAADEEFPPEIAREIDEACHYYGIHRRGRFPSRRSARNYAQTFKESPLFERLEGIFLKLADSSIPTRFGFWSDDPECDLESLGLSDEL